MSLADLVIDTREIPYRKQTFTVRGLCFNDLVVLFREHGARLDQLKAAGTGSLNLEALMVQFPDVIAHGIALAADAPEKRATVAKMPLGVQIKAALAVWELTMQDAGTLEQLLGEITAAFTAAKLGVGSLNSMAVPSTGYHA